MEEITKKCSKCDIHKSFCEFRKSKKGKYGINSICKVCQSLIEKEYRLKNPNRSRLANKKSYEKNKNLQKMKEYRKKYYENNLLELKKYWKKYRESHTEKRKQYGIEYREKNRDTLKEKKLEYYQKNKKSINNKKLIYSKKFLKDNPHIKAWRTTLRNTIKRMGHKKNGKTIELLGYSALDLKNHIEKKFTEGMSWENYGKWHIDHIKPVSSFDKGTPTHIVNALDNLQPLWGLDNLKKGKSLLFT